MIQSVDRALRVLAVLQGARRRSLGEIAAGCGLAPSTVHGLVRTLLAHGMVVQERDSGLYRLGPATLRLGNVYLDNLELRARAQPWVEDLARRTGCAVRVAVALQRDAIVVGHEPRPDGSRQMTEVGIVVPAHACAVGKALLAYGACEPADRPHRMTGETVTEVRELDVQLAAVRRTGLATEIEEAVLGECGLAAPVAAADGVVAGAIGLVVPAGEWPLPPGAPDALRHTARAVSRELGAASWPPLVEGRDEAAS
ncbi:IclR family transcriptional regulator [Pseudonocardia kujensis]|uniref:IclR family transcriptional regulator n=1 Tax=Pseudonocardia kujensis TaxID=1128675 RepID=UPI001E39524C|nr:IclR family transcriptional regulator [Pseudonocardia kujensis]MCE0768144.1 IclR family transcriptional regulator [Pseudonocardia kujensis]